MVYIPSDQASFFAVLEQRACTKRSEEKFGTQAKSAKHLNDRQLDESLPWVRGKAFFCAKSASIALFTIALLYFSCGHVFDTYAVVLLEQLAFTADRKWNEVTYFKRSCSAMDSTARSVGEVTVNSTNAQDAVELTEKLMTHGIAVLPDLLTPATTSNLRKEVLQINESTPKDKQYHVIAPDRRWSVLLDPNDSPAIQEALREVASHPTLRSTLEDLLGPQPAMMDLCAITSEPGAKQQFWHQDTSAEASSLLYGRTFLPAYSVFIYLQDTTSAMGATGVCPGTHMCTSADTSNCFQAEAPSGTALVMNSQLVHAGMPNIAYNMKDGIRAAFMLGFTSKPREKKDPRFLPLGTTYSTSWHLWGHTLDDLMTVDTLKWSPLESLGIIKWREHMGWTLQMSLIAQALSGDYDDFMKFIGDREFVTDILIVANFGFLALLVALGATTTRQGQVKNHLRAVARLCAVYTCSIAIAVGTLHMFSSTDWAKMVRAGERFPRVLFNRARPWRNNFMPRSYDVVVGDRHNAAYLFKQSFFLDYHPGNRALRDFFLHTAALEYSKVPSPLRMHYVRHLLGSARKGHLRFVKENDYGGYVKMSEQETLNFLRFSLLIIQKPVLKVLSKEIDYIKSQCKYNDGGRMSVLTPFTDMGTKWTPTLMDSLKERLFSEGEGYVAVPETMHLRNPTEKIRSNNKINLPSPAARYAAR